jgi:hypothetical protein
MVIVRAGGGFGWLAQNSGSYCDFILLRAPTIPYAGGIGGPSFNHEIWHALNLPKLAKMNMTTAQAVREFFNQE